MTNPKNEGVLFHCYECDVDMVQIEDRGGKPAYQCPKCLDVAQFDFSFLNQISEQILKEESR